MPKVTSAQIKQDLKSRKELRKNRAGGSGDEFPFRIAKVMSVDPKRMTCSLFCLTGNEDSYDSIALTFPNAGARHFLGAIPEVNDLCVIGYSSAESGHTRSPHIVGWLIPGTDHGYDWVMSSPTREEELYMTPALQETLKGAYGRRRHKLRQMEAGNIVGSSAQGSDIVLNESVLLANRRGNELSLRDQDQALVTRSLQRFHAGAGVRMYSGMVQRDATLLPTQMFSDGYDWSGFQQVNDTGEPLSPDEIDFNPDDIGKFTPNPVFDTSLKMGYADPDSFAKRGLYIGDTGEYFDGRVIPDAVYGGKPIHRVSVDGSNGVLDPGMRVYSEWRIEVSNTADGTLPVTEQTDGVDIDRLLAASPKATDDGGGDLNPLNRSPNESMASMVLGTAVGNDPYNDRESYGLPLIAQVYDASFNFSPTIRGAINGENPSSQSAFLVRIRNPYDLTAPEAFLSLTKGGSYKAYFPGASEEYFGQGQRVQYGTDPTGQSLLIEAAGTLSLRNTGKGRPQDNLGIDIFSQGGGVSVYGGSELALRSAKSAAFSAVDTLKLSASDFSLTETNTATLNVNNTFSVNAGDTINLASKTFGLTSNGKAEFSFGGPKNGLGTNGALRNTTFTGLPLTGALGGSVDDYLVMFGGRSETFLLGRHETAIYAGSYDVGVLAGPSLLPTPDVGIKLHVGPPLASNSVQLTPVSASLESQIGVVKVSAQKGAATITGSLGVYVKSAVNITLTAPFVTVTVGTLTPGGVLTDGCLNPLTGRPFLLSGSVGVPNFRVL